MGDATESPDKGDFDNLYSPVSADSTPVDFAALSPDGSIHGSKEWSPNKCIHAASSKASFVSDKATSLKPDVQASVGLKEGVSNEDSTPSEGAFTASESPLPTVSGQTKSSDAAERSAESPKSFKMPSFPLPDWLLEHCVTLRETWKDAPDFLTVVGEEYFDPGTGLPISDKMRELKKSKLPGASYAMSRVLFDPLLELVSSDATALQDETTHYFTEDLVVLQTPSKVMPGSRTLFLESVVKQFAKNTNADLVFLALDDVKDFTQKLWEDTCLDEELCTVPLFQSPEDTSSDTPSDGAAQDTTETNEPPHVEAGPDDQTCDTGNEPFAAVLGAPSAKRSALSTPDLGSKNTPTIVFVSIQSDYVDNELFESTRRVLADFPTSKRTIVLVSRCKADLDDGQNFQGIKSINVLPVRTSDMQQQLLADRRAEKGHRNLRLLQRRIRHRFPESEGSLLTRPHAPWPLAHDPTVARQLFTEHRLKSSVINDILEAIANRLDDDRIRKAVLDFCRHKVALGAWSRNFSAVCVPDDLDDKHDPWRNFPVRVREVLNMISGNKGKYEWENHSLHLLVDPVEAEEAWASIAVDEDLVASVKRVVAHHQSPRGPGTSYGILKQEHTGGALFYGPPGTGKTLLARVLAHSTDSIVISATAADIQSVWCGEAPKVVKGLFNLARLIAPSIIFIDEADALFGARNSSRGYQSTFYQSTTTQLLNEMDGFSKSMDTPLVILATNLPGTLDPAVLRRVPNFTYMGLPTLALREQIFRIMLREEILAPDVSIVNLARMTNGFSGSDIKSLCVQVALSCDTLVATGEKTGKRLLTWSLFQRALARATPSASEASMAGLRDFAREFDPLAFQKMNAAASEKAHN